LIRILEVCDRSSPNSFRGAERTESGSRQGHDAGAKEVCNVSVFGEVEGLGEWGAVEGILNMLM
jgi:hypothetical protein